MVSIHKNGYFVRFTATEIQSIDPCSVHVPEQGDGHTHGGAPSGLGVTNTGA